MKLNVLVITAIVAIHVAADIGVLWLAQSSAVITFVTLLLVFALPLSQLSIASLWFGLSARPLVWRLVWFVIELAGIAGYAWFAGLEDFGGFLVFATGLAVLIAAFLAGARGCRIINARAVDSVDQNSAGFRFSVADLMVLTAVIAAWIAAGSAVLSMIGVPHEMTMAGFGWTTCSAMTGCGVAWLILGRGRLTWRLAAALMVILVVASTAVGGDLGVTILFGVQAAIVAATLVPLRIVGYTLAIQGRSVPAPVLV